MTRPFLLGYALILAIGFAAFILLWDGRDPADRARVVDVKPSSDGRKAAVAYVYTHANSSGTTVRVAISERPFPALGEDFTSKHTIAAVRGGSSDAQAKAALHLEWQPNGSLAVCAASGSLILFSADGETGDHAGTFEESELASFSFCDARPHVGATPP
jgi:hypothetical protein